MPRLCTSSLSLVVAVLATTVAAQRPPVLNGIDVLDLENFSMLQGAKVGLITNQTGRNRHGERTIDVFRRARNLELVAILTPEHGLDGTANGPVADSVDAASGVPVFSLYGETRTPTPAMLEKVDALVFDIQDIGCRHYTYAATLLGGLRAAAQKQIRFVVLDRPNPLGALVQGPVLDPGRESFVGVHTIPIVHGMTMAELARMMNTELGIEADLRPALVRNWQRREPFDRTGLRWVDTSPNIRSFTAVLLYPATGTLEFTNLSVGRGTDWPFEVVGAPWIDAARLAVRLQAAAIPGVSFVPRTFTPTAEPYQGVACQGLHIHVTDRAVFDPIVLGVHLACALRDLYPAQWRMQDIDKLLADAAVLTALQAGKPAADITALWKDELAAFAERRQAALLYPQ